MSTSLVREIYQALEPALPAEVESHRIDSHTRRIVISYATVELSLTIDPGSLSTQVNVPNGRLSRATLDPLRQSVRSAARSARGGSNGSLIEAAQTTIAIVAEFERKSPASHQRALPSERGTGWLNLLDDPDGVETATERELTDHLLGASPEQVVEAIPAAMHVNLVEPVLKKDLVRRFLAYQGELRERLRAMDTKELRARLPVDSRVGGKWRDEEVLLDLLRPRVAYFAASQKHIAPIIRFGFKALLPTNSDGKANAKLPITRRYLGQSCITSSHPLFEIMEGLGCKWDRGKRQMPEKMPYSLRLIACAIIPGRTAIEDWSWDEYGRYPDEESYETLILGRYMYLSSHELALLPCYVIDLDLRGDEVAKTLARGMEGIEHFNDPEPKVHPRLAGAKLAPGDAKREKERKKAAGLKWFSSGVGASSGTQFTVEDVGRIDDDEEDYGNWQEERRAA